MTFVIGTVCNVNVIRALKMKKMGQLM